MAKKLIGELSIPEKYTINQTIINTSWNDIEGKPDFATVAETGNYDDLNNKPTLFDGDYNSLNNKPVIEPLIIEIVWNEDNQYFTYSGATYAEIKQAFQSNRDVRANVHRASWLETYGPVQIPMSAITIDGVLLFSGDFNGLNWDATFIAMGIYENGYQDVEGKVQSIFNPYDAMFSFTPTNLLVVGADKTISTNQIYYLERWASALGGNNVFPIMKVQLKEFGDNYYIYPQLIHNKDTEDGLNAYTSTFEFSCAFYANDKWYDFNLVIEGMDWDISAPIIKSLNYTPRASGVTMDQVEALGYQTADQVNALINSALGVIENGSY